MSRHTRYLFATLGLAIAVSGPSRPAMAASVAPVAAANGMVVTAQHRASRVGVEILKQGGNAVDAAVAVGYALAVVYPAAGNLGGGGFLTLQLPDGRKAFLDFREKAPLAARANMYLGESGQVVPGLSTQGYLAVAVPGTVAGLEDARKRYGTLSREAVLAPAIALAESGFELEAGDVEMLNYGVPALRKDPASAAIFLNQGRPFEIGEVLVQKDLAQTLRAISQHGEDGFYKGAVSQAIVAASQAGNGILSQADFDQYRSRERAPVECNYRGYTIVSAPPPSSGGVVICEILNILEAWPLKAWGFRSAQAVHVQIEAMRHAYADRNTHLGDPDFVNNPVTQLTDKGYAAKVRSRIDLKRAGDSKAIRSGLPGHEGSNTTHYSIIDAQGLAVSVTYTLNGWFGAHVMAPGTGVLLNNEMDDFTSKAGVPNAYGLVQGEANAIAPGKRPLSSMSPTLVTKDGKVVMILGTPGGSRIITAVLHTLINVIDYGMNVQEAVDAPRFHQQWLPSSTSLEPWALSPDTQKLLEDMGHVFSGRQPANHVAAILIGGPSPASKAAPPYRYFGANDPRRNTGLALGY